MANYKLTIAYDGTNYRGWQYQPDQRTVQGTIHRALQIITKKKPKLYGAGRTDAGVHAIGQVANFHTKLSIPPDSMKKAINSLIPPDIRILKCEIVDDKFNARFHSKGKVYEYRVYRGEIVSPFLYRYVAHVRGNLNVETIIEASKLLIGEKDFSSFTSDSTEKNKIRRIENFEVWEEGDMLYFRVKGSGFLKYMVRIMVGTLLEVGRGKISPEEFQNIIEAKDRTLAGPTAPPQGLFLLRVLY